MGRRRALALIIIATLGAMVPARAADSQKMRVVWYSSHKCEEPVDKSAPGATPERPLEADRFDAPIFDVMAVQSQAEGKEGAASRFYCKWVRLHGFFVPTAYYHYRGVMFESAWERYRGTPATSKYLVENFRDLATRRSAIGHRRVTMLARFYYLCASAPQGDDIMMLLGPCHYGGTSGMMLTDAKIEKIEDAEPLYLRGEANRLVVGDLMPVEGDERTVMSAGVRSWAALLQRGREVFAREVIDRNPRYDKMSPGEREHDHARVVSPDSYESYLTGLPAFKALDVAAAQVAVFWAGTDQRDSAVGCICLQERCEGEWPIVEADADSFYGRAACTTLEKHDSAWIWR